MQAREIIANNIRKLRQMQKLSQEDFAEKAELHRTYIGSIERGERNVSVDNLERIAKALGVDIRKLFDDNDEATWRQIGNG